MVTESCAVNLFIEAFDHLCLLREFAGGEMHVSSSLACNWHLADVSAWSESLAVCSS